MKKLLLALTLALVLVGCSDKKESTTDGQTTNETNNTTTEVNYKEITVKISGTEFSLPIQISELKTMGWEFNSGGYDYTSKSTNNSTASKDGVEIDLQLYSFAPGKVPFDDAFVVGVTVDYNKNDTDASFMGKLQKGSTLSDI